ncbi:hypothetical protein HDV03_000648 [Kappamyces sp. JEL0829]|nr:hypothetical protein HDV03_000648 [Kappamyces sp. JEL0829]
MVLGTAALFWVLVQARHYTRKSKNEAGAAKTATGSSLGNVSISSHVRVLGPNASETAVFAPTKLLLPTAVPVAAKTQLPWSWDINEKCEPEKSSMSPAEIVEHRTNWTVYLKSIPIPELEKPPATKTRGIVHSGVIQQAVISIKMLRHYGCKLPVEIWHFGPELRPFEIEALQKMPNVTVRDIQTVKGPLQLKKTDQRMWEMKGASLLYSSFDEVLLLDTDNVPARDPTFLFESQAFQTTGAVFWKDFTVQHKANAIWSILGMGCTHELEQESGQVLIDKSRPETLRALYLAAYMQAHRDVYFKLFWGDKETFRLAWRALGVPYHMIRPHLAAVGVKKKDQFCGQIMAQFGPMWIPSMYGPPPKGFVEPTRPQIVFMHNNLLKYDHLEEDGKYYRYIKRYRHPEARQSSGGAFDSGSGLCTDLRSYIETNGLTNEAIVEDFTDFEPNFEDVYRRYEGEAKSFFPKVVTIIYNESGKEIGRTER